MSLRDQQYKAIQRTRTLLADLINAQKTPRVPRAVRDRAYSCLKHYPHADPNGVPVFSRDPFGPDEPPTERCASE